MANILSIEVDNLPLVLDKYNQIKVYKSDVVDGIYLEITDSVTRLILNNQDTLYTYIDTANLATVFYKTSYYHSITHLESTLSSPVAANLITNQLVTNMQVLISLSSTIKNISGQSIGTDTEFYFTTIYDPLYSSVRKLRLEVGSFIKDLPDDTLNLAIFEASLMANGINWAKNSNSDFFRFARREWVTCKAAETLLNNIVALLGATSKKLDNLEIHYDSKIGQVLLDKVQNCLAKWEAEVISGGHAIQSPSFVVKGDLDPDAPHVGRMWEKGPRFIQTPGSNSRVKPARSRRYINSWIGQNIRKGRLF